MLQVLAVDSYGLVQKRLCGAALAASAHDMMMQVSPWAMLTSTSLEMHLTRPGSPARMYAQCCMAQVSLPCIRVARVYVCHPCYDLSLACTAAPGCSARARPRLLLAEAMYTGLCMCKQGCKSQPARNVHPFAVVVPSVLSHGIRNRRHSCVLGSTLASALCMHVCPAVLGAAIAARGRCQCPVSAPSVNQATPGARWRCKYQTSCNMWVASSPSVHPVRLDHPDRCHDSCVSQWAAG